MCDAPAVVALAEAWLDETDKATLRAQIHAAATALAPDASRFEA